MRNMVIVLMDFLSTMAEIVFFHLLFIYIFGAIAVQLSPGHLRNRCLLDEDIPTEYNVSYNLTMKGQMCSLNPPHNAPGADADVCVKWNVLYNFYHAGDQNKSRGAIIFDQISFGLNSDLLVIEEEGLLNIMLNVMNVYSFYIIVICSFDKMSKDKKKRVRSRLLRQQLTAKLNVS